MACNDTFSSYRVAALETLKRPITLILDWIFPSHTFLLKLAVVENEASRNQVG